MRYWVRVSVIVNPMAGGFRTDAIRGQAVLVTAGLFITKVVGLSGLISLKNTF